MHTKRKVDAHTIHMKQKTQAGRLHTQAHLVCVAALEKVDRDLVKYTQFQQPRTPPEHCEALVITAVV